jgi:hypothetical protein
MGKELSQRWQSAITYPLARTWLWYVLRNQEVFEKLNIPFELLALLYKTSPEFKVIFFVVLSKWESRLGLHIPPTQGFLARVWVNFYGSSSAPKPPIYFRVIECAVHHFDNDKLCIWCGLHDENAKVAIKEDEIDYVCLCGNLASKCICETCKFCGKITKALDKEYDSDGESEGEDGCDCIICDRCNNCQNEETRHEKICGSPDCNCGSDSVCPECGVDDCECPES